MRSLRPLTILFAAFALSACVGTRPDDTTCPAPPANMSTPAYSASLASAMAGKWNVPHDAPRSHVDILVLSGGGAWGAYGAGFLTGWSARAPSLGSPRPQFDVVTGVSTGAIIAPFALLGPDYDPTLDEAYRGTSSADLFQQRSYLSLPFWNSFNDSAPLENNLTRMFTDKTIDELAQAYVQRRSVWAGAVNFDSGHFTEFDLTELAATNPTAEARKAIVDRLMGASAVPGFFPPRFIDHCMYMDGGVRENLFVSQIGGAIDDAIRLYHPHHDVPVNIYAIVNGTISPARRLTDNTLIGVGIRGFELAADQIQLASLREIYDYAKAKGFHLYWASAEDVVAHEGQKETYGRCSAPTGTTNQFDAAFTACLFDAAKTKAETAPSPWRTDRP